MKQCVVNFADQGWYLPAQARQIQSLCETGFKGQHLTWNRYADLDCPPHSELPYGFKVAAIRHAAEQGFTHILWCDSPLWAVRPLDPLFERINDKGYVFFNDRQPSGDFWYCDRWTNDRCLEGMGFTREQAKHIPMCTASCFGLNLEHWHGSLFWERLQAHCKPELFCGNPANHRWDQSVISLLIAKTGLEQIIGPDTFYDYYRKPYVYGAVNLEGIKDSVVLLSQAM